MNGPAARLTAVGDKVIVMAFAQLTSEEAVHHKPKIVVVDKSNNPAQILEESIYRHKVVHD